MPLFRRVILPPGIEGALLLHSIPGRREPLSQAWREITKERVDCIVSLAGVDEGRKKAPEYADAIDGRAVPCERLELRVTDYGVPEDRQGFWTFAQSLAQRLRDGGRLLIHCGAGVGRTGMLATAVLLALGEPPEDAEQAVRAAGSAPETREQRDIVRWCTTNAGR